MASSFPFPRVHEAYSTSQNPTIEVAAPPDFAPVSSCQDCTHILLHYACKSAKSADALFKALTTGYNNPLVDDHPLAEFLRLPPASLERVASQRLMIKKVNKKVVEEGSMLLIHFNGLCIVVLIACYAPLTHLIRIGSDIDQLGAPIAFTVLAATPLLALEMSQARAMYEKGLFRTWAFEFWNLIDVVSVLWVPVTLVVGFVDDTDDHNFEIVASVGGLLLMFKLLHFLRFMNKSMAAFVSALAQIMSDIVPPCTALAIVLFGFGFAMFNLVSKDTLDLHDEHGENVRAFVLAHALVKGLTFLSLLASPSVR